MTLLELRITPALAADIATWLADKRYCASAGAADISTPELLLRELARQKAECQRHAIELLALLSRHATEPLDCDVLDACNRLQRRLESGPDLQVAPR